MIEGDLRPDSGKTQTVVVGLEGSKHSISAEVQQPLRAVDGHQTDDDSNECVAIDSCTHIDQIAAQYRSVMAEAKIKQAELEAAYEDLRVAKDDAAEAHRQSEAQLRAIDRVQGRIEFSPDGIVLDINEKMANTLGYEADEVIGEHHRMFVAEGEIDSQAYEEFWQLLRSGGFHQGEYHRVAKDGTSRWIDAYYSPVLDERAKVRKVVKYATDVTGRKSADKASRTSARKASALAQIITESPNEVYIINQTNLSFEMVNDGAARSTGYTRDELLRLSPLDLLPDYNLKSFRELTKPLARERVPTLDYKTSHKRKDGSTYSVRYSLHITRYDSTPVFVAFVNDLTQIEALEDQLSRARKLESIGQMAAGIAHEINTPMQYVGDNIEYLSECSDKLFRVVDGYREVLDDIDAPEDWANRRKEMQQLTEDCRFDRIRSQVPAAIEESREGVQRTVKIVRAMKDFSHPGSKEMTPGNLNELIESTVAISRNRWKYAAQVSLDLNPDLPEVPILASEINQVLLNLIINAGDAIAEKHEGQDGSLGTISVRTTVEEDWVVVQVADDGCGIPKDVKQKVFDPFFTTKDVGKGTGQGLAITHNVIVNQHKGVVTVDSEPGEGTVFTVKLPR